eukprot:tig00021586_g22665.t1
MAGRMLNGDRLEAGHRLKLEDGGTALWDGAAWKHDSTGEPMKLLASGNKYWRGDSMEYRRRVESAGSSDEYSELSDPDPDEPSDAFATENERSLMRIYESLREAIYWEDPPPRDPHELRQVCRVHVRYDRALYPSRALG